MLRGPKGEPIDVHKQANENRLRGERLNQIRKDINNKDLSDKEKVLKYGSHLEWFRDSVNELFSASEAMRSPGKWDGTIYATGLTNGLIFALAIFMEEQGTPPFKKFPTQTESVVDQENKAIEIVKDQTKGFMINLARQLECIICMGQDGYPKGYADCESVSQAWLRWRSDTIDRINNCPVHISELQLIFDRIREFNQNLTEENEQ